MSFEDVLPPGSNAKSSAGTRVAEGLGAIVVGCGLLSVVVGIPVGFVLLLVHGQANEDACQAAYEQKVGPVVSQYDESYSDFKRYDNAC